MNGFSQEVGSLFEVVKSDFSDLWSIKHRQDTIEFVTPYTTMAGEAISVFLTKRDVGYVVSDGGRLFDIATEQDIDTTANSKVHYAELAEKFAIKETSHDKRKFCYKVTPRVDMLSACVYDLAYFQETVANAIYHATLFETEQSQEARYFVRRVKDVLTMKTKTLSTNAVKYVMAREENARLLRFPTAIRKVGTDLIWLGMTIHRSNIQNYERSVFSADFGFRRANRLFSGNRLSMSAVIDTLPGELANNTRATFLQGEMSAWERDLGISSLSLTDIEQMNNFDLLFRAAS